MKRSKYKIIDWAGNECFYGLDFTTFEEAYEALTIIIEQWLGITDDDKFEEEIGEYDIERV